MEPNLKTRLEEALRRREELSSRVQRLVGRLEEAETALETLRGECRSRNVDPDRIGEVIGALEGHLEGLLSQYEACLSNAQSALDSLTRK